MPTQIPARETSKYCGQYAMGNDPQRLMEIFSDSHRLALSSKNPQTASDRFDLAVEAYHQIMSLGIPSDVGNSLRSAMETLADMFPAQVVINEATGLREKARKYKTQRKQLETLNRAKDVLELGIAKNPGNPVIEAAIADVLAEIAQCQGSGA